MQIALDATPLTVASGGVRRYVEELSRALAERFPEDGFWLVSDQKFEFCDESWSNLKAGGKPRNALERRWWSFGLNRELARLGIDLFHGTDFSVPYRAARPSVMTLHDLSPWMDPAWHRTADRIRSRTPRLLRFGLATMVVTPSNAVRNTAIDRFQLPQDRVVAIPLAASRHFRPVVEHRCGQPYFLYAGTLEPRKNVGFLLEVWREVRKCHDVDLVLAGRRRSDFPEIPAEPGLRLLGYTSEADLPRLYSCALAVLYPSYYEGFGLPVLEAMQCGALVIASRDPAIAEVAGDGAILLDTGDRHAWVETCLAALSKEELVRDMQEKAKMRASEFSWEKTAQRTREVYGQAVQRFLKKA